MKRVVLTRNGQHGPRNRETSDLKAGRFRIGEHVMLGTRDADYGHVGGYYEYVVDKIESCDRFGGGRETVTFQRVLKRPGDGLTQEQRDLRDSPLGMTLGLYR